MDERGGMTNPVTLKRRADRMHGTGSPALNTPKPPPDTPERAPRPLKPAGSAPPLTQRAGVGRTEQNRIKQKQIKTFQIGPCGR